MVARHTPRIRQRVEQMCAQLFPLTTLFLPHYFLGSEDHGCFNHFLNFYFTIAGRLACIEFQC